MVKEVHVCSLCPHKCDEVFASKSEGDLASLHPVVQDLNSGSLSPHFLLHCPSWVRIVCVVKDKQVNRYLRKR